MSTLSTHVLDTTSGEPAVGMGIHLSRSVDGAWEKIAETETDHDGRAGQFGELSPGTYRLGFETGAHGNQFYPFVHVVFRVEGDRDHFHIPLLLSRFGYTTYRGS